jgi:membrane protein required for colicin V production
MTVFDYLVLFILIASIIISTMRGVIKEILSLASWVIAFWVANAYGVKLAEYIPVAGQSLRLIVGFIALFIGVHLLMWIVAMMVDSVVEASGLKLIDRGFGSLFGLARGCIIVLALMLVGGLTSLPQQPFWRQAMSRPVLEAVALSIKPYLPGSYARYVKF